MHYTYLIIGGGMTAAAAIKGIRQVDAEGAIGLIGAEPDPPYNRPPLSKGLWKGKMLESIWRPVDDANIVFHLGRRAVALDAPNKRVTDDQGASYTFDRLLLATGGTPRALPFGGDNIIYYRTVRDYQRLRQLTERGRRFAVIGGGFIGSEIAAALAMNDKEVVMLLRQPAIGAHIYPAGLAQFLNDHYHVHGVEVLVEETVSGLRRQNGDSLMLTTEGGRTMGVDGVVAGIGLKPNTQLAEAAGLEVGDGIVVDSHLRSSSPDIYAAGDVASFFNPALNKRLRVEHEDNANTMGQAAGRAMAGDETLYEHLPFFYSDLFDLGYEAVGELDARLEMVEDWQEPFHKGVVYYLKDGRVRGVLLWNVWDQVDHARRLIAEPGPFQAADLKGRLPE